MYVSWLFINIKNFGIYRKYRYISTEEFIMKQKNDIEKSNIVKKIIGTIYVTLIFLSIYLFFQILLMKKLQATSLYKLTESFFLAYVKTI